MSADFNSAGTTTASIPLLLRHFGIAGRHHLPWSHVGPPCLLRCLLDVLRKEVPRVGGAGGRFGRGQRATAARHSQG